MADGSCAKAMADGGCVSGRPNRSNQLQLSL